MLPSTSRPPKGILLDTNVLSRLAAANQLALLQRLAVCPLYITRTIHNELLIGFKNGLSFIQAILDLIQKMQIQILSLEVSEAQVLAKFPNKLALGESEAIAICQHRNMLFITRDRKAANYCDRIGVGCIRFAMLLQQFQQAGLLTQSEVAQILT